jgi:outer membrane protein OmpA-like peptidoglycan-associated protein
MTYRKRMTVGIAGLAIVLVAATGCVSKKRFRTTVEETDSRIGTLESDVESGQRRMEGIETTTNRRLQDLDSATERANRTGTQAMTAAERAAEEARRALDGKLLWTMTLSDDKVKFPLDKATLSDEAKVELDELASRVKELNKAVYLEIEGHTDSTGEEAYNRQLGRERAEAVLRYLNEMAGIPLHAMNVISHGENTPIADNSSRDGRSQNRRVVVKVLE